MLHFRQVFTVAKQAGFVGESVSLEHVPFGTMMGSDNKPFKTREGGVVKLMDFGIARLVESNMTVTGSVLGTPAYMAPEQRASARSVDGRADVFAAGNTLYSLLTGEPPFSGPTPKVFRQVMDTSPKPLRSTGVPIDLETITLKCMEKDPSRRYPSARAFAEDLQRFLDDIVLVSERELAQAFRTLLLRAKVLSEPAGAVASAGFLAGRVDDGLRTVAVVTGGNLTEEVMGRLLEMAR